MQKRPDFRQNKLTERLDMSLGVLNYCLGVMLAKGQVKLENYQSSKHMFKYVCVLTTAGIAQKIAMTGCFLKRNLEKPPQELAVGETLGY